MCDLFCCICKCKRRPKASSKLIKRYPAHCVELIPIKGARAHSSTTYGRDLQTPTYMAAAPTRRLVGLVLEGKRVARQHAKVLVGDDEVGVVTSGCQSPTLERSIAMAYVTAEHAAPGVHLEVDLGRARTAAEIVPLPFYKSSPAS